MGQGAHTPEELETLLEDAFVTRDPLAVSRLFERGAVLASADGAPGARGVVAIVRAAAAMWEGDGTYVGAAERVVAAGDIALVLAERGLGVARRGPDGDWRYAIALMSFDTPTTGGTR